MPKDRQPDRAYDRIWWQTPPTIWARVKAVHAQWQVQNPDLKLKDTVGGLLSFALKQADQVWQEEMQSDALREQQPVASPE